MEDALKRLLEAETRAEALVEAARRDRERSIDQAVAESQAAEARFEGGLADLRAPFDREAEARAEQSVAELTRKYHDRQHALRELAAHHQDEAVAAALALLLDPDR